jgi:hypothetical protein
MVETYTARSMDNTGSAIIKGKRNAFIHKSSPTPKSSYIQTHLSQEFNTKKPKKTTLQIPEPTTSMSQTSMQRPNQLKELKTFNEQISPTCTPSNKLYKSLIHKGYSYTHVAYMNNFKNNRGYTSMCKQGLQG